MIESAAMFLGTGLLLFFLSLPLAFRMVPMNRWYGFRVRPAFESDQRWYEINAYGGLQMAIWSWLIIAAGITGFFLPESYRDTYSAAAVGVLLVACLVPIVLVIRWIRRNT